MLILFIVFPLFNMLIWFLVWAHRRVLINVKAKPSV
jgi:hypothetical protein